MGESMRDDLGPPAKEGIERRDFIRRLLITAVGLPTAASALLAGCGGEGFLENDQGGGGLPPVGTLDNEVADTCDLLQLIVNTVRALQDAGDADVAEWLQQINARIAAVWPLMLAADQQALRDNVHPDMQDVLAQLDADGMPLSYQGAAPQVTEQQIRDAWDRADQALGFTSATAASTVEPSRSDCTTWVFLLFLFLLFPAIATGLAANIAAGAEALDTGGVAVDMFDLLHPTGPVGCTPCFFGMLMSMVLTLGAYLYLAMASHAAVVPGVLWGLNWLVALVFMSAILMLTWGH